MNIIPNMMANMSITNNIHQMQRNFESDRKHREERYQQKMDDKEKDTETVKTDNAFRCKKIINEHTDTHTLDKIDDTVHCKKINEHTDISALDKIADNLNLLITDIMKTDVDNSERKKRFENYCFSGGRADSFQCCKCGTVYKKMLGTKYILYEDNLTGGHICPKCIGQMSDDEKDIKPLSYIMLEKKMEMAERMLDKLTECYKTLNIKK